MAKPNQNQQGDRPSFMEDAKKHIKSVWSATKRPWKRWGYLVYLVQFCAVLVLRIRLTILTPERHEPTCAEGLQAVEILHVVTITLLITIPASFIFIYFEILEKHCAMIICVVLAVCFCFSLSGFINSASWFGKDASERLESMMEYSKKEYSGRRRIASFQKFTENKYNCCGITDFMDYPTEIFNDERVPDHCCTDNRKGCGRFIFYDTPFQYSRHKVPTVPPNAPPCLLTSNVSTDELLLIRDAHGNLSYAHLHTLVGEFLLAKITEDIQCGDMTMNNFLTPQCIVTTKTTGGTLDIYSYKYRWCYIIFYNENNTMTYRKRMNDLLHLVKPNSCLPYLDEYADTVILWTVIGFALTTVFTFLLLLVYLKYYEEYRAKLLTIHPIPLWYQRLPGESDQMIPAGLGRPCHVNDPLAMTSEREARAYLRKHPHLKEEAFRHMKEQNESKEPRELIPRAALIQHNNRQGVLTPPPATIQGNSEMNVPSGVAASPATLKTQTAPAIDPNKKPVGTSSKTGSTRTTTKKPNPAQPRGGLPRPDSRN